MDPSNTEIEIDYSVWNKVKIRIKKKERLIKQYEFNTRDKAYKAFIKLVEKQYKEIKKLEKDEKCEIYKVKI